jgi:hypothetical protein
MILIYRYEWICLSTYTVFENTVKITSSNFFLKNICLIFLMFSDYFDVLMSKINF